jgi:hypothetical protein
LRVSRIAPGQRGDSREAAEEVQRRSLAGEDRAQRPPEARDCGSALHERALLDPGFDPNLGVEGAEDSLDHGEAAHDAGLLEHELAASHRVLVDRGLGRDIALAHVLGERRVGNALEGIGGYSHVSSVGSEP